MKTEKELREHLKLLKQLLLNLDDTKRAILLKKAERLLDNNCNECAFFNSDCWKKDCRIGHIKWLLAESEEK